jgi:transcriptional regulator with XRE-family HTH domain
MESLREWLEKEIVKRNWKPADLARAAGIPDATLSRILNETRGAGPEACTAIANALNVSPAYVFQLAGLLPPDPDAEDLIDISDDEIHVMNLLREARGKKKLTVAHFQPALQPTTDDLLAEVRARLPGKDLSFLEVAKGKIDEKWFNTLLQDFLATVPGSQEENKTFIEMRRKIRWNLNLEPTSKEEKIDFIMSYLYLLDDDALEKEVGRITGKEEREENVSVKTPRRATASS